jgi:eukaryotic-like serine/threonine-protein kinase
MTAASLAALDSLQAAFDALLEQDPAARERCLLALDRTDPGRAGQLRRLLAHDGVFESDQPTEPALRWGLGNDGVDHEIPGYRLIRQIGAGGMGRVHTAIALDDPEQCVCAVKAIRHELASPLLLQRFALECEALASLAHPGIARFIRAGHRADGSPFVVMEYIEGEPIDRWCNQRRLPLASRIALVRQLVEAVEHAHQHLIIHRDIKPENVLVDAEGKVTLVDFGVAKSLALAQGATITAERFLTPRSAAPEQMTGGGVGTACDVHGIGLLLYRLLCGCDPYDFDGVDPLRLQEQLLRIPAPGMASRLTGADPALAAERGLRSIAELQAALRGDLEQIVLRCLRKRPDERYPGVRELDRDLRNLLEGRAISERENERWYRLRKFIQRHRLPFALVSATLILLCASLVTVVHQRQQARHERDRAESAIGLLRESFAAANPLNTSGGHTAVSEVLDAALPLLEQRRHEQPELYADLAATMAVVELAAGRPQQALRLAASAIEASRTADRDTSAMQALQLLHARALLESGELLPLASQLDEIVPRSPRDAIELQLMRGRLAYMRGEHAPAAELLESALAASNALPQSDPLALDVRLYLAQAQRLLQRVPQAVALLDETLSLQARHFAPGHPRVLMTRMRRHEYARHLDGPGQALPEMLQLEHDIAEAFGQRSALLARVRGTIGQLYLQLDATASAVSYFRRSWQGWQAAASPRHPNALRSLFNLAYTLGTTGSDIDDSDRLFRRLLEDAAEAGDLDPRVTNYWRIMHVKILAERHRCPAALAALDAYFGGGSAPLLSAEAAELLTRVSERTHRDCGCAAPASMTGCAAAPPASPR